MRINNHGSTHNQTPFIAIDSNKCSACWNCIEACPNNVIGKINLIFHKHSRIKKASNCIGCLKCLKACKFEAIYKKSKKISA